MGYKLKYSTSLLCLSNQLAYLVVLLSDFSFEIAILILLCFVLFCDLVFLVSHEVKINTIAIKRLAKNDIFFIMIIYFFNLVIKINKLTEVFAIFAEKLDNSIL